MLCEITPDQAGKVVGGIVVPLLFVALVAKMVFISRRATANFKCVFSLMLLLGLWAVALMIGNVFYYGYSSGGSRPPAANILLLFAGLVMMGAFVASVVFAILGLVEYAQRPGVYKQGRTQAIWTLALNVVFGGLVMISMAMPKNRAVQRPGGSNAVIAMEDLNFRFRAPSRPWVEIPAKDFNRYAKVAFTRANPSGAFCIIAEKILEQMTTENLLTAAKGNLQSAADDVTFSPVTPVRNNGMDGLQFEALAEVRGRKFVYSFWICATNGYAYQLITSGAEAGRSQLRADAQRLRGGFELIDSRRIAVDMTGPREFVSPHFHYSATLANSSWSFWKAVGEQAFGAEFGALRGQDTAFVVVPMYLMGNEPHPEALTGAMLATLQIPYPSESIQNLKSIGSGPKGGMELDYQRTVGQGDFKYRIQITRHRGYAYMIAAWVHSAAGNLDQVFSDAVQRVSFKLPSGGGPTIERLSAAQSLSHSYLFNEMGLFYFKARQYEASIPYFKQAFECSATNSVYIGNLLDAYGATSRAREGLEYLEGHSGLLMEHPKLRAYQAWLLGQEHRTAEAVTNYARLFKGGFQSEEHFTEYVDLLSQLGRTEEAATEIEQYLRGRESLKVRLLQAQLYNARKKHDEAIRVLKPLREKYPYKMEIAYDLIGTYQQAGLEREGLALCRKLIDGSEDTSTTIYYLKGRAEMSLKWFREAKESFEMAHRKAPSDRVVKDALDFASAMLGEGSNTSVKEPVEPVPLPLEVRDQAALRPLEARNGQHPAYYESSVLCLSFKKGKEFKKTEYAKIRVLDSAGVSRFSTLQYAFDPAGEQIFVNTLKVRDEQGDEIGAGKISEYYVVDDTYSGMASQKKLLNVPVPALRPGALIELAVTWKEFGRAEEVGFTECVFSKVLPVARSAVYFRGNTNEIAVSLNGDIQRVAVADGALWTMRNPMIYKWEPFQAGLDFLPAMALGPKAGRWETEATNYIASIEDRLKLDAEQQAVARRLVSGVSDEAGKVRVLAQYVQSNYTYKAIEFGRRARIPRVVSEIVHSRYGDCKEHSLVLQQMLEAVGIPARLALVASRRTIKREVPSLDQFDHMIVFLPQFRTGFFLDCADKESDLMQGVPLGLGKKEALILDGRNPKWVPVPDYSQESGGISTRREIEIVDGSDAEVRETVTFKGHNASFMRGFLKSLQPSLRSQAIQEHLNSRQAEIMHLDIEHLESSAQPLAIKLTYRLPRHFHKAAAQIVGFVPSYWERRFFGFDAVENRQTPFQLMPLTVDAEVELVIPSGYRLPEVPAFAGVEASEFLQGTSVAKLEADRLKIRHGLRQKGGTFPPSQYATCRAAMQKALASLEQNITLQPISQ